MNKTQRSQELQRLLNTIPIWENYFDEFTFTTWQGKASGLLSFDRKLQSDFQGAVNSIDTRGDSFQKLASARRAVFTIKNIMSQAIGELDVPEEQLEPPVLSQPAVKPIESLTDEHSFWWWITHCTWPHRWRLLGFFISPFVIGAFLLGLRLGMMDEVRNLFVSFTNPHASQSNSPVTDNQPIKYPTSIKPTDNVAKNFDQPKIMTPNASAIATATPK